MCVYIYIGHPEVSCYLSLQSTVDFHLAVVTWETCFSFLWVPCTFRSRPSDDWQQFRTCQTPWNALSGLIGAVCTSKMTSADTVAARACEADSPMDHKKNDWLTRFDQKLERHPGSLAFAMEQRVSTKSLNWFSEQSIFSHIHCRRLFEQFQSEAASRTYRKTQFFTAMEPQPLIAMSCGEQGAAPAAEVVPKDGKEGSKEGCNCCGAKEAGLTGSMFHRVSPFHPFCEGWSILEMMGMNG